MAIIDEEQPLLRVTDPSEDLEYDVKHNEVILDFEPMDPEDPRNWATSFKWFIVLLLALMAFTVYFSYAPHRICHHELILITGRLRVSVLSQWLARSLKTSTENMQAQLPALSLSLSGSSVKQQVHS